MIVTAISIISSGGIEVSDKPTAHDDPQTLVQGPIAPIAV